MTLSAPLAAGTIRIDVAALDAALDGDDTDALRRAVLEDVGKRLEDAGIGFADGALLFAGTLANERFVSGCNRTDLRTLSASARITGDSALVLTLDSLRDPIRIALSLDARVEATGRARQRLGLRLFGGCRGIASDTFTFEANGPIALALDVELRLAPRYDAAAGVVELRPTLAVAGELERVELSLDVDDSLLERSLEDLLERRVRDALDPSRLGESIAALQADAEAALAEALDDGVLRIVLPTLDDERLQALFARLGPDPAFPLSLDYARARAPELLAALLLGDEGRVADVLGQAATCEAATLLQVPLPHPPLHAVREAGCTTVRLGGDGTAANGPPLAPGERTYSDAACQHPLDVTGEDLPAFCRTVLDGARLGDAGIDPESLDTWSLSAGTRLDVLALPLAGVGETRTVQPFTRRVRWKSVETGQGLCELDLRVHTLRAGGDASDDGPSPLSPPLRPLLAFHGGSWQHRSTGFLGIESMAPRFAGEGFVVFAPFHRLVGTAEGNAACNGATLGAVLEDTDDALDWVLANAAAYGADGPPVVFGQSSGGHLAASLAVARPDDVAAAVLFYAPLDFGDLARELNAGDYRDEAGRRTLERLVGDASGTVAVDDPLVLENSFPARVARARTAGRTTPPVFLLHGGADELVPARQSVRLCDALGGDPETGPAARALAAVVSDVPAEAGAGAVPVAPSRRVVACDAAGSELHLIAGAGHALDLCIADGLCRSGSGDAGTLVADSLRRMLDWLGERGTTGEDEAGDSGIEAADDEPEGRAVDARPAIASGARDAPAADPGRPVVAGGGASAPTTLLVATLLAVTGRRRAARGAA